ncbi:MAG: hypothetical protein IJG31_06695 [Fusobacterium sp.]|nr:hypothetical protein [Fusobacterium sp.]
MKFIDIIINKRKEELAALKIGDLRYNSLLEEIKKTGISKEHYETIKIAIDKYINVY